MINIDNIKIGDTIKGFTGGTYEVTKVGKDSIKVKRYYPKTDRFGKEEEIESNIFSNYE